MRSRSRLTSDSDRPNSGERPNIVPSTRNAPSCTPSAPGTRKAALRTACPRLSMIGFGDADIGAENVQDQPDSPAPSSQDAKCHSTAAVMCRRWR